MKRHVAIVGFALACLSAGAASTASFYQVGDAVRDETVRTLDGETLRLTQFRGKVLVLTFLTAG